MLTFFPAPYSTFASHFVSLLDITNVDCERFNLSKRETNPDASENENRMCGCNCSCSTKLAILFANETSLLGNLIHVVSNPGHIFLVYGDRVKDWAQRRVSVIETTDRLHEYIDTEKCDRPLISLKSERPYETKERLIPNFHEFYLDSTGDTYSLRHVLHLEQFIMPWIVDFIMRSTNIFGLNILLQAIFNASDELRFTIDDIKNVFYPHLQSLFRDALKNAADSMRPGVWSQVHNAYVMEFDIVADFFLIGNKSRINISLVKQIVTKVESLGFVCPETVRMLRRIS